jgi:hypothetical protein
MATIRQQILELRGRGYTPTEIYKEMFSRTGSVSKTLVMTTLRERDSESNHQRRTELIYEMVCKITAMLESVPGMRSDSIQKRIDRMQAREHPVKEVRPLPPTEPGE